MEELIKAENLSVAYNLGKTSEVWALRDVSLKIYPEEYVIFFGPSGCGKSTLLYAIAGLEFPTSGKMTVEGKDLKKLGEKELIEFYKTTTGMIFQAFYLIPNLNVRDNILLPQVFAGASVTQRVKKADQLMKRFGISNIKNRRTSLLSGGQRQRVAIARSLINDPDIILADEPVGNLDSENAEIVLDLLSGLNRKDKKTIIQVTHNPQHLHVANRVFYMKDGKVTRTVRNPEKKYLTPWGKKEKITEYERIAQAYPYLSDSRVKAKMILNHILYPYSIETQQKVEKVIDRYLNEEINKAEMKDRFDLPPDKGGAGIYTQTAKKMSDKIAALAKEIELIEEVKEHPALSPIEERAMTIRGFLLDEYSGQLSFEQIKRLEEAIAERITGKMRKNKFRKTLDDSFSKGGVGLNRRTARKFSRRVELILMKRK